MKIHRIKRLAAAMTVATLAVSGLKMGTAGAAMNCSQLQRASERMAFYMDLYMDLGWYDEWDFAYASWQYYEGRIEANGC